MDNVLTKNNKLTRVQSDDASAPYEVDRIITVIKPTEHFLNWLRQQPTAQSNLQLQNIRSDCTVLLIPPFETPKQARAFIRHIYQGIFENELSAWRVPEKHWPEKRSFQLFQDWFEVEYHSVAFDLGTLGKGIIEN